MNTCLPKGFHKGENIMGEKFKLSEKLLAKRNEMMTSLLTEIRDTEEKINQINESNKRMSELKRRKKMLLYTKYFLPFVVSSSIAISSFSFLGLNPFVIEDEKKTLETKTVTDSLGNTRVWKQYEEFSEKSVVNYYSKWNIVDGVFYREVNVYDMSKINVDSLYDMIETNDLSDIKNVFGEPIVTRYEARNYLEEDEYNSPMYIEMVVYDEDKDDYIFIKESFIGNLADICISLVVVLILLGFTFSDNRTMKLASSISDVDKEFSLKSTDDLVKSLSIKLNNYNRLKGE